MYRTVFTLKYAYIAIYFLRLLLLNHCTQNGLLEVSSDRWRCTKQQSRFYGKDGEPAARVII